MFKYKIEFWDEIDNKVIFENGITCGTDYGEAANKVAEFYGYENVISITLTELEKIMCEEEVADLFKD